MKKLRRFIPVIALLFLAQCSSVRPLTGSQQYTAAVTRQGLINCFEKGLTANGQPVWCEASAVLYDGKNIFFANDKDMPDTRTSLFYWAYKNGFADTSGQVQYIKNDVLKYGKKFEDFSLTPDGKTVFLTTAFDRIKPGTKEWDGYNCIYYWQPGKENEPRLLRQNAQDSSSVFLREKISKALSSPDFPNGPAYFKIEGLAATNDQLFFGVREEGKKFDDFKYEVKILSVSYQISNGVVTLENNWRVFSDININNVPPFFKQPMGLSSLEYDHFNNRFLIMTSYENGDKLGGYLWSASMNDLANNKMTLVRNGSGSPIAFLNKPEDIAVINNRRVVVIYDDDRVQSFINGQYRLPNQAGYSVVDFR